MRISTSPLPIKLEFTEKKLKKFREPPKKYIVDLSIKIWKKNEEYVAGCQELDIYTYGKSKVQARERLVRVILFYAETASEMGYKIDPAELLGSLELAYTWRSEHYVN